MKTLHAILFAGACVLPFGAQASADLAQSKNCMSCHTVDKKLVGPSFKDVAAKYKGKGMEAQLETKVKKGSAGAWGPIPMPGNNVSDADAQTLVKWVLSQ